MKINPDKSETILFHKPFRFLGQNIRHEIQHHTLNQEQKKRQIPRDDTRLPAKTNTLRHYPTRKSKTSLQSQNFLQQIHLSQSQANLLSTLHQTNHDIRFPNLVEHKCFDSKKNAQI
ncbi:hypothetical protein M0804_013337 [Polistes exclamans]|nr:hypothetical protein M0804_013337 [Polistes exclamans]